MSRWLVLSACLSFILPSAGAPTWPSSMDELEDIMFLNTGYRARGFSADVTPCAFSSDGPGRITAAEWIRTAFHDMISAPISNTAGGLDASIIYETRALENIGFAFNASLLNYAPFFSSRASMSDLIAMGVYTAVRSCGGPIIPIRTGRIDATRSGSTAFIPQPQNSLGTFQNQFSRVGFNNTDMIIVTACGHTIGGVHASFFPEIVTPGTAPDNFQQFDNTPEFDTKIAVDFLANNSTDPLVVGPSRNNGRDSDRRVFMADNNITIASLTDPAVFRPQCARVLQKMIDVVPRNNILTDPITPYDVKPVAPQLTLLGGAQKFAFTGEIRVRTTTRPSSQISKVELVYKDRSGGNNCGSCATEATLVGTGAGFDDSFAFYAFSTEIQAETSISSFNVVVTNTDGQAQAFSNKGVGYAVQDTIMLQQPQSCVSDSSTADKKNLTIVAAVRSTASLSPVNSALIFKVPRRNSPIDVPALQIETYPMTQQANVGLYTLYALAYALNSSQVGSTVFNVSSGTGTTLLTDSFKYTGNLPNECIPLGEGQSSSTSSTVSTPSNTITTIISSTAIPTDASVVSSTVVSTASTTTPSPAPYEYYGCFTDSVSTRALSAAAMNSDSLTISRCASFCSKYSFFGLEYAYECYCGNTLTGSSSAAPDTDCNMACTGASNEICGAGDRLSVYVNSQYSSPRNPTVEAYDYKGCYTDDVHARVLRKSVSFDANLTIQKCHDFCGGSKYFGAEYGQECYCGDELSAPTSQVGETECNFRCSGDDGQLCGAGSRITLYEKV